MVTGIGLLFMLMFVGISTGAFWWMGRPIQEECHPAPTIPFTVGEAHAEMQERIDCDAERCACKAAAFKVLIEAGHATPGRRTR